LDSATQIASLPFDDPSVSNAGATREAGEAEPSCGPVEATVWYKIVPSKNGLYRLRAKVVSRIDVVLAIYEGTSADSLTERACSDDRGPSHEEVATADLWRGHTYFMQVGGSPGAPTGGFSVRFRRVTPPANDNRGRAKDVALGSISYVSTTAATTQPSESQPCDVARTVWYRYSPSRTRTIVANTVGSDFDTALAVYAGTSPDSLELLACNDDREFGTLVSRIELQVEAGSTYFFQAGGAFGRWGQLVFRLRAT
jgi:hypothetical protein